MSSLVLLPRQQGLLANKYPLVYARCWSGSTDHRFEAVVELAKHEVMRAAE